MRLSSVLFAALLVACRSYAEEPRPPGAPGTDAGASSTEPVYVAPMGRDFAEGTKSAPVATFKRALEVVTANGATTIHACPGTYTENVVVDRSVQIIGDRSCSDGSPMTARARIAPPDGVALRIANTAGVSIEGLDVSAAADHTQPGASAVGVFVSDSTDVVLRRVEIRAGRGMTARDGASRTNHDGALEGGADVNTCKDASSSTGGRGAGAVAASTSGSSIPAVGADNAGTSGGSCSDGGGGENGIAAVEGGAGARAPFAIGTSSLEATAGSDGANGNPGQGGGGGGKLDGESSGGPGGAGGCGGGGGRGGGSGGSSIALATLRSSVSLDDATLIASDGAAGGAGGAGQPGQAGSVGRPGEGGGCSGGGGGNGSGGAGGGGGAGGHSLAILHVGAPPRIRGGSATVGAAGSAGAGGSGEPRGAGGAAGSARSALAL